MKCGPVYAFMCACLFSCAPVSPFILHSNYLYNIVLSDYSAHDESINLQ